MYEQNNEKESMKIVNDVCDNRKESIMMHVIDF